jgi:hypothetical protein
VVPWPFLGGGGDLSGGDMFFCFVFERKSDVLATDLLLQCDTRDSEQFLLSRVIRMNFEWVAKVQGIDDEQEETTGSSKSLTSLTVLPLDTEDMGGLRREGRCWYFQRGPAKLALVPEQFLFC